MRSSKSSLALLGLLGSALAHEGLVTRRKTMGFGPVHPHAKFHTSPTSFAKASLFTSDPYDVASSFITTILQDQLFDEYNNFALRKDSYTDKATGVTHVFFRQMINGIEVADGDINVNVKDGTVISYGDSVSVVLGHLAPRGKALILQPQFYRGSVPSIALIDEPITSGPHAEFCDILQDRLVERLGLLHQQSIAADQITMSGVLPNDEPLERMHRLHRWNCEHVRTPSVFAGRGFVRPDDLVDPRNALLQFMIAATPNEAVVTDILSNHDQIIEDMSYWFEPHFISDDNAVLLEMIDNVPDAVSPVKARPVYIQLPDGDKTMLVQAWRVSTPNFISSTSF